MRVYFIKDFTLDDGRTIKAGQDAILWDATRAINSECAIPYDQKYESQAKTPAKPQSGGTKKGTPSQAKKKSKN